MTIYSKNIYSAFILSITLLLLSLSFSSCENTNEPIENKEAVNSDNHESITTDTSLFEFIVEYYPNDTLKFVGKIYDSIRHGYCKDYYENGIIESQGRYKAGKKDGWWEYLYPNGKLSEAGHYHKDLKCKHWTYFNESGSKLEYIEYDEGIRNGTYQSFFANGNIKREGKFYKDKKSGWFSQFNEEGGLIEECGYINDKKDGAYRLYVDDYLLLEGNYAKNNKVGKWITYNSSGKIISEKLKTKPSIAVIIPAFNEENSVGKVVRDIPSNWVDYIIVCNNNSNDQTKINALNAGAIVVDEPQKGYGNACLKGMAYLVEQKITPDIVVYIDADYSDFPEQLIELVAPIIEDDVDLVIGSRATGDKQKHSMTPQQIFGNWLATKLIKWFYKVEFTDLGPFRAVRYDKLLEIDMQDKTYGWTVEMQVKAAKLKMKCTEIPVSYRVRIGKSKVSGTLKGTLMAGYKIITTIFKYR